MSSLNLMNRLDIKLSLPAKIALFSLVLTLIGVIGVAFIAYNYSDDVLQKKALQALTQKVDREGAVLSQVLRTIQQDAKFLVESPSVLGIGRALANDGYDEQSNMTLQMWQERLTDQLRTVLRQRDIYYQLRLIGVEDFGRELIRVARIGDSVEVIPQHELQQKGSRKYFMEGVKLAAGEMYVSDISLNRERGEITYPPRPMLRIVTALHSKDGEIFGVLVINAGLKKIAANLKDSSEGITYFIANNKGDYLIHPDEKRAMAFEYGSRARAQDDYSVVAGVLEQLSANDENRPVSFDLPDQHIGLSLYHAHFDPGNPERFLIIGAVEKLSSLRQESLNLRNKLLVIVSILALLLALATFWMVRYVTRPISHLKRAADRVAAGENNVHIPVSGHDEIASLGESFRDMLSNLSASRAELRKSNVVLEEQVSQRTHDLESAKHNLESQNVELAHALVQANEAAKAKSQFLATMSHEIRTPLNGVLGLTELVLDTKLTGQQRDNLETVHASGETLLTILNDILDFSKMEAGQFELDRCEFSPNDLVEHITKLYSKEAHRKHLELIGGTIPTLDHQLNGDPDRLRQVLMNLLSNAIKFTHAGEVVLQVEALHEDAKAMRLRFSVTDTGIGISEQNQHKLFDDFSQVDASHSRKYGGTGLGLSIARKLVRLMGGDIIVESEEGTGSRFWFEIELEKGEMLVDAAIHHEKQFRQWRVLIVDDNATNRRVLHHMVTNWGMRNGSVEGGREALDSLIAEVDGDDPYHIALIDQMMPEMDGMELAQRIKQEPRLAGVKVIMLSSLDEVYDSKKRDEYGLDSFLRKPIHQSALYNLILSVMGVRHDYSAEQQVENHSERSERILLAEDVDVNQQVAIGMLKKLGFTQVDIANNGVEAVNLFDCGKYALILMDLQMPEMDGYTVTREIRAIEKQQKYDLHTPIVALTAHAFAEEKEKSLSMGMDDLLTKPLTGSKLAETVNIWIPAGDVPTPAPEQQVSHDEEAEQSESMPATLDADLLRRLHHDMGGGIGAIIDMYVSELPAQIENISQSMQEKDSELLKSSAHRLKGTSRNIGALALAEMCAELEVLAGQMDVIAADELSGSLRQKAESVLQAFNEPWLEEIR